MTTAAAEPFLVFRSSKEAAAADEGTTTSTITASSRCDVPIYFQEDWNTGIGGGLWSTGLAFSKYLTTSHAAANLQQLADVTKDQGGLSVLELGSGNSFLSVCILGLAHQLEQLNPTSNGTAATIIKDLVITDFADHLPLMQKTLDANRHISNKEKTRVRVLEHKWGEFLPSSNERNNDSFEEQVQQGTFKFDLILGSDVAYREDLFDILIASLLQYSHANTVILIGVTMLDTKPAFFHKLRAAGFDYTKFADHLLEPDFRGQTFGVFAIQRRHE